MARRAQWPWEYYTPEFLVEQGSSSAENTQKELLVCGRVVAAGGENVLDECPTEGAIFGIPKAQKWPGGGMDFEKASSPGQLFRGKDASKSWLHKPE
jgi:hypothetical protein